MLRRAGKRAVPGTTPALSSLLGRKEMELGGRVLIADDEAPCRLIVARILKQAGYSCSCAQDAQGTLALLERDLSLIHI